MTLSHSSDDIMIRKWPFNRLKVTQHIMWPYFGTPTEHIQVLKCTVSSNSEYKYIQMRSSPSLPSGGVHSPHVHISSYKHITLQIAHCTCEVPRHPVSTTRKYSRILKYTFVYSCITTYFYFKYEYTYCTPSQNFAFTADWERSQRISIKTPVAGTGFETIAGNLVSFWGRAVG